jgi:hypothetical protein
MKTKEPSATRKPLRGAGRKSELDPFITKGGPKANLCKCGRPCGLWAIACQMCWRAFPKDVKKLFRQRGTVNLVKLRWACSELGKHCRVNAQ